MAVLKRSREEVAADVESVAMANCLMLLSRLGEDQLSLSGRVFECKTCRKQFHSFQALGGHRASHKKPRLLNGDGEEQCAKKHVCAVCGLEFDKGQALGGHMSKHRAHQLPADNDNKSADHHGGSTLIIKEQEEDTSDSIKVAIVLSWDLNLTPVQNELMLATDAPSLN